MKIAWVTDSTAFLDEDMKKNPDVYTIPLSVLMDEEEFLDGIDLTARELFDKLKTLKNPPKTSQPSVGAFQQLYESLSKDYDQIVSILLSSKLSGTFSSSQQASQLVDIPVLTIDSKILSYPLTALIKKGMEMVARGDSLEVVESNLKKIIDTNETIVLIGSLEQLHRSGRMSGLKFLLGSMLSVKPIISIVDGVLHIKEKARSEKKAKDKIVDYLRSSYEKHRFKEVYILYGLHLEVAENFRNELKDEFPEVSFVCCPLGATIGVHAGENTLGISWFNAL
ncbi:MULTISPECIES: DegV family protein [unclassified Bacillus (in: firmicutes)]|uniref:DegV family protein n=1 Tax=unclassified Bacillus (in: firmicutes) TaxID=185979 RepID=UPI0008F43FB4|nr:MULTISPECIES: DegV family protein [unclassified Bacillus (in: firmicutes)]SFB25753.1 EDD domain protein, DegV family [Bacillus sp. UNCCL13]SFQ91823.1 EDD domain protein, DegV family [Bacillus sp. cl95]